jgi:predicted DNA-binding transcriptional regulator YafY
MRRADRLFEILQLLRTRRNVTARLLADELKVSERTIYRDVADLTRTGVPIEGEAGVGYRLRRGFELPPLMFTRPEIEAIVLGARMVESWSDEDLVDAAGKALRKVEAALPEKDRDFVRETPMYAPTFHIRPSFQPAMKALRQAIEKRRKARLSYTDREGVDTDRVVRPLGLLFWGDRWSLAAWCELREAFRHFRLDRMADVAVLDDRFVDEEGRTLDDYFGKRD